MQTASEAIEEAKWTNRIKTHGKFENVAIISQAIKAVYRKQWFWQKLNSSQREALDQMASKIGRTMAGDPNFVEHWEDIAGYAMLAIGGDDAKT